jgi:4-phytase/acid phosphatase
LLAAHNATPLAQQIAALLIKTPGRIAAPATARVIVLAGHDTNLSNIAGMLGVTWRLPGQPDSTAPDTALAFEVWRDGKTEFVRLRLFYQTLDQLRDLTRLSDPPRRDLTLSCTGRCTVAKVAWRMEAAMAKECLSQ